MKIANTLEESLNGGWPGLFGEVVTCDIYRLRKVKFVPDIVFDIGGNVGTFTRFARQLWPEAIIVAVEPDPSNIAHFKKFTPPDDNIILMECALGNGPIYHGTTAVNGGGETYLSPSIGFPFEKLQAAASARQGMEFSQVESVSLAHIIADHWAPGMRSLIKIDCEGAENCIWNHGLSMHYLRRMDYITMELHSYAIDGSDREKVIKETDAGLADLAETHDCEREHVTFWATKR